MPHFNEDDRDALEHRDTIRRRDALDRSVAQTARRVRRTGEAIDAGLRDLQRCLRADDRRHAIPPHPRPWSWLDLFR